MFRYLNHRFHWNNISFQIPDSYYFDSDPELPDKNAMWLVAPGRDFHISINIVPRGGDTLAALSDVIIEMIPDKCISPIKEISVNGLHGHHASYALARSRYYEIFLDFGSGMLNIVIWGSDDSVYDKTSAAIAALDLRSE